MKKELLQEFELLIQVRIFDKVYDKQDFLKLIELFNDIHLGSMSVTVVKQKKKK